MTAKRHRRAAFTLIELLIVVGIIGLLIAILAPSLSRARDQAKRLYCANNLRNIWTGVLAYALQEHDRLPFMENPNDISVVTGTGPAADPFDPRFTTSYGVVLGGFVESTAWVCPSAVAGFPATEGGGPWKVTYQLGQRGFGGIGRVVPWTQLGGDHTGGAAAQYTNYWPWDGRPIALLDGRRYVPNGRNENEKGKWDVRFPIISDMIIDETQGPSLGRPLLYPHRGILTRRVDLQDTRQQFEQNTNSIDGGYMTGRNELHADGEQVELFLTRTYEQHANGY